ncbi:ATP-binding protein [Celeribacter halophilus]|uniref:ATP-binding protein n=1 Tax=Celeribacter halophilus TaxID=576117 RepID=UPI001C0A00F6|nr:YhaN family protein [Celeribacter halophilus]MBU2888427.1 AAA family ATPase [Celeribacter halophilus]MDO6509219.1 AAA family ATPase [Celeribacter halophilus]
MRLQRLDLDRFGHFTDRSFDFGTGLGAGGDRPDFHIIYGPNEAGKTTTMEAALRLFYGFPMREGYAFKHPRNNLQVSATLEIDGTVRRFTRLPKRSGALVDETGTVLPETALSAHLAGLSEEDYRQLLCLDDETIERGGEEIANAQGDIGRLLFSAAAGVADLSGVLDGVRERADTLWKKRGRTTRIAELKRELATIESEIRESDVSASAWKGLKHTLSQAQHAEEEARVTRNALFATKARIEGQRRALPLMAEISALEARINAHPDTPVRLDFDPERLIALRTDHGTATANIERLTKEIAALETQIAEITVDPERLELAEDLDALQDLSIRDRGAQLDLTRRKGELRAAEAAMNRAAQDLGAAKDVDPQSLALSQVEIAQLEQARDALIDARRSALNEARELDDLTVKYDAAKEALVATKAATEATIETAHKTADAPLDAPRVTDLLARFDVDRLAPAHASALQAIHAAEARARKSLSALRMGAVTFETLPPCPGTHAQAQAWAERHNKLTRAIQDAREKCAEHHETLAALTARAEALTASGTVTSDREEETLFAAREARWAEHLNTLDEDSARTFREALLQHDTAMKTRVAHASELGQLRQIEQDKAEAHTRAEHAEARLKELQAECAALEASVTAMAEQAGLPTPLTPAEWLDWVSRHATAEEDAEALRTTQEANRSTLERAERLCAALAPVLPFDPVDLDEAMVAARQIAEAERHQAETVAKAREHLAQAQHDLDKRKTKHQAAQSAEAKALQNWQALIAALLGDQVQPDTVMASLAPLRDLREQEKARATALRRVEAMEADQTRFAQEVTRLAEAQGLELRDSAAETYTALRDLCEQARTAHEKAKDLSDAITRAQAQLSANTDRLREIDQEVATIAAAFPDPDALTDIDALRQRVQQAAQVIAEREELARLRQTVMAELDVQDMDTARARLANLSLAELDAATESNQADLAHAEEALTQAIERRSTAAEALKQVTGDADIATLEEKKATLELELEEAARAHLELSLGHYLASDAIRRYRDSHRSGMMAATERCFSDLTRGAYPTLSTQPDRDAEVLMAVTADGTSKRASEMSKGTRFQLYLALRAAAHEQLVAQGTCLPFFCDDIFETFDETRTSAACRVMETIGRRGQAIYLTHHRHVVDIAQKVCDTPPVVHEI